MPLSASRSVISMLGAFLFAIFNLELIYKRMFLNSVLGIGSLPVGLFANPGTLVDTTVLSTFWYFFTGSLITTTGNDVRRPFIEIKTTENLLLNLASGSKTDNVLQYFGILSRRNAFNRRFESHPCNVRFATSETRVFIAGQQDTIPNRSVSDEGYSGSQCYPEFEHLDCLPTAVPLLEMCNAAYGMDILHLGSWVANISIAQIIRQRRLFIGKSSLIPDLITLFVEFK